MSKCQEQKISLKDEIRVPIILEDKSITWLGAITLAQSAYDNEIDLDSFVLTLNTFSDQVDLSKTPIGVVYKWREQAADHYLRLSVTDDPVIDDKAKTNKKFKN